MKKTIVGLIGTLLITLIVTTNVYAANEKINLQINKNEFNKDDEIIVNVEIAGIKTARGIAALMSTLEYDKDSLELTKIEGQNGWAKPGYNANNGQLITDKNSDLIGTEIVMKFTFKVKDRAKQSLAIALKDTVVSDGEEDIEIANTTKNFTIKNGIANSNQEEDINQNPEENSTGISNETNNNIEDNNINQTENTNRVTNNKVENNNEKSSNQEKKSNLGLIIAVIIIALVVIVIIRIQVVKKRRARRKKRSSH